MAAQQRKEQQLRAPLQDGEVAQAASVEAPPEGFAMDTDDLEVVPELGLHADAELSRWIDELCEAADDEQPEGVQPAAGQPPMTWSELVADAVGGQDLDSSVLQPGYVPVPLTPAATVVGLGSGAGAAFDAGQLAAHLAWQQQQQMQQQGLLGLVTQQGSVPGAAAHLAGLSAPQVLVTPQGGLVFVPQGQQPLRGGAALGRPAG